MSGSAVQRTKGNSSLAGGPDRTVLVILVAAGGWFHGDLPALAAAENHVIYVHSGPAGTGDGQSWGTAFAELSDGLLAARAGDHVWVAVGTYRPTTGGDRTASLRVPDGVLVYGGFAGDETSLAARAGLFDETILTGDLLGDDGPGFSNRSDNSYHVVRTLSPITAPQNPAGAPLGCRLDGFCVTGGNAEGTWGGGLLHDAGVIYLVDCAFRDNEAPLLGAAIANYGEAWLIRCLIERNRGNAIDSYEARLFLLSCRLIGNEGVRGGAAGIYDSEAVLQNCVIAGNHATWGGGVYIAPHGAAWVESSTFVGNTATLIGGGISNAHAGSMSSPLVITNSIVVENQDLNGIGLSSQVDADTGKMVLVYSCIQGLQVGGGGNVIGDPQLVDSRGPDQIYGTADDDLRLSASSPCVDAGASPWVSKDVMDLDHDGDKEELVPVDIDGTVRFWNAAAPDTGVGVAPLIDMGAYEYHGAHCQPSLGYQGQGDLTLNLCGDDLTSPGSGATIQVAHAEPAAWLLVFTGTAANPLFVPELGGTLVTIPVLAGFPVALTANSIGMRELRVTGNGSLQVEFSLQVIAVSPTGGPPEISNALWVTIGV